MTNVSEEISLLWQAVDWRGFAGGGCHGVRLAVVDLLRTANIEEALHLVWGCTKPQEGSQFCAKKDIKVSVPGCGALNSCLAVWFLDILPVNFWAWLLEGPWTFRTFISCSSSIIRSFLVCCNSDNLISSSIFRVRRFSSSEETGFCEALSISWIEEITQMAPIVPTRSQQILRQFNKCKF